MFVDIGLCFTVLMVFVDRFFDYIYLSPFYTIVKIGTLNTMVTDVYISYFGDRLGYIAHNGDRLGYTEQNGGFRLFKMTFNVLSIALLPIRPTLETKMH